MRGTVTVLTVCVMTLAGSTLANATVDIAEQSAERVSEAAALAGAESTVIATDGEAGGFVVSTDVGLVSVEGQTSVQVTVAPEGDVVEPVSIGLPEEVVAAGGRAARDGSLFFEGVGAPTDVVVQVLPDGVRISTVLDDHTAPDRFTYPIGEGATPHLEADGSVSLLQEVSFTDEATGETLAATASAGVIAAPWAIDAAGQSVPTWYEIEDGAVVQVVAHRDADVTYPIVADPEYTRSWANQYFWFNRAETKTISQGGWGAAALTGVCVAAGGPVAGAVCGVAAGALVATAGVAENSSPKKCVALRFTNAVVVNYPTVFTYRDSRCR